MQTSLALAFGGKDFAWYLSPWLVYPALPQWEAALQENQVASAIPFVPKRPVQDLRWQKSLQAASRDSDLPVPFLLGLEPNLSKLVPPS